MKKAIIGVILIIIAIVVGYMFGIHQNNKTASLEGDMIEETDDETDAALTLESVAHDLEGTWQSTEDLKSRRTFTHEHVTDYYDGEMVGTPGAWELFTSDNPHPAYRGSIEAGATYLALAFEHEALFFKIADISKTNLDLIYLDGAGNGVLSYMRVPELE